MRINSHRILVAAKGSNHDYANILCGYRQHIEQYSCIFDSSYASLFILKEFDHFPQRRSSW